MVFKSPSEIQTEKLSHSFTYSILTPAKQNLSSYVSQDKRDYAGVTLSDPSDL